MFEKIKISRNGKFFITQITFMLALLSALSPMATDTYIPALGKMSDYFMVDFHLVEFSVTIYFIGVAVGQFFGGPLSDSFGRKTIAVFGISLYSLTSLLAPYSSSVEMLWFLRFVMALGGGCASVVNMAFVRDWFEGKQVARLSSLISLVMMLAPLMAPIIGTVLLKVSGWKAIFHFLTVVSSIALILFILFMPESRSANNLSRRISFRQIVLSYVAIFRSKKAGLLVFANSFVVSAMFTFITASSFMFIKFFGLPEIDFPIYFGSCIAMNGFFTFLNFRLVKTIAPEKILNVGITIQLVVSICILIGTLQATPTLAYLFPLLVFFVGCMGLVFPNIVSIVLNRFPEIAGSANATIGVLRFAMSGAIGSLLAIFPTGDLKPMGIIMACCTLIAYLLYLFSKMFSSV